MKNNIELNDNQVVSVLKQDHFGRGIAKVDNLLVFVDKALPFDECRIEIVNRKKNYLEGIIKEIVVPSSLRVVAKCPYYDFCGGCHIMHEIREGQNSFKKNKVKELLERFTGLKEIKINSIITGKEFYYRNKIVLHSDFGNLGFYQEKTHELVPINSCVITALEINNIYVKIRKYLNENKTEKIKQIMIRSNSKEEVMIALDGDINNNKFISYFKEVKSIYLNGELIYGDSYLYEEIFNLKFKIYPKSFFQVNKEMTDKMYGLVIDYYKKNNYSLVLDLYCGTGTIGMLIAKYVSKVIGVEVVSDSVKASIECQKENSISNIKFYNGKVEDLIDSFNSVDSIIVDPPRKGLDKHTIDCILKIKPKSIVYISCDPATLARDLNILKDNYSIIEVNPIDMFPNTYHVENVVFLEKK